MFASCTSNLCTKRVTSKHAQNSPEVDFESSRLPENQSPETAPICIAVQYHPTENDYRSASLINSKTISQEKKNRNICYGTYSLTKTLGPQKKKWLQISSSYQEGHLQVHGLQAFTFFIVLELSRSRSVARGARVLAFAQKLAPTLSRSQGVTPELDQNDVQVVAPHAMSTRAKQKRKFGARRKTEPPHQTKHLYTHRKSQEIIFPFLINSKTKDLCRNSVQELIRRFESHPKQG